MHRTLFRLFSAVVLCVATSTGTFGQPAPVSGNPLPPVLQRPASEVMPRPPAPPRSELKEEELYRHLLRATALVVAPDGFGTAWVLDREKRWLVTNHHVVVDSKGKVHNQVLIVFPVHDNGRLVTERAFYQQKLRQLGIVCTVVDADPRRDLAILQPQSLPANVAELKLAPASPNPGESLHVVGNPGSSSLLWHYSPGRVRQVGRMQLQYKTGQAVDAVTIATTSPINPGDSGGPAVNKYGELVGVNAAHREGNQLMSACIDVSEVKALVNEVRQLAEPRTVEDHVRRAAHYAKRGRYELTIADCNQAISREPRCAGAFALRALAQAALGNAEPAMTDLNQAIALRPNDATFVEFRGDLHAAQGMTERARADFRQALQLAAPVSVQHTRIRGKLDRLPPAPPVVPQ